MLPHIISTQNIVDLFAFHVCSGGHLTGSSRKGFVLEYEYGEDEATRARTYLFGDGEFVWTGVTGPFVIARVGGDDEHV